MADAPQKHSGHFACLSGLVLFLFVCGSLYYAIAYIRVDHLRFWFFYALLAWSVVASICLFVWGLRAMEKYHDAICEIKNNKQLTSDQKAESVTGLSWIGIHTLEMIGGLSAAIIAAVTLALIFMAGEETSQVQRKSFELQCQTYRDHANEEKKPIPDYCSLR